MLELFQSLQQQLIEEFFGIVGGVIFCGSWMLQAWESRQAAAPVVSERFFWLRSLASALLTYEGYRTGSASITFVMFATLLLMLYNIYLLRKRRAAKSQPSA